jgi:hypothetical protein
MKYICTDKRTYIHALTRAQTQVKIRAEQAPPGTSSGRRCPRLTCRDRAPAGLSLSIPSHPWRERAHLVPTRGRHSAAAPAGPRPHVRVQTHARGADSRHTDRGVDGTTGGALPSISLCIATPCRPLRTRAPFILTLFFASRSARPSMSALTMSTWPWLEAAQSGVHPSCRRDAQEESATKHRIQQRPCYITWSRSST